jgi:hypothetical protein
MAFAETANLAVKLTLGGNFNSQLAKTRAELGKFDRQSRGFKAGAQIGTGIKRGLVIGTAAVATGIGLLAVQVDKGINSLAELEDATTAVDGAIKQMGQTGKVTSGQVAAWANEIEASVHAAFDDKDITAAAATLLRFGKVTSANLRPALVVMTDLAAKTGDVQSASTLLAKVLADPTKAAARLTRAGVVLTAQDQKQLAGVYALSKAQQKHLAALQKLDKGKAADYKAGIDAGKQVQAQAVLLAILTRTLKDAADTSQGPYHRALNLIKDTTEDAQRALAEGFLPVLEKVADIFRTGLAKPGALDQIRDFGKGLARGLDSLITTAQKLPWSAIGDSLRLAGTGAKAVLDAFTSLPAWVQTAVLTGWGLNKLTGGLVTNLIGGALDFALKKIGVMNVQAAVVNVAGGVGGVGGGIAGAAKTGLGLASKVFLIGEAIGLAVLVNDVRQGISDASTAQSQAIDKQTSQWLAKNPSRADLLNGLKGVDDGIRSLEANPLNVLVQGDALDNLRKMRADIAKQLADQATREDTRHLIGPSPDRPWSGLRGHRGTGRRGFLVTNPLREGQAPNAAANAAAAIAKASAAADRHSDALEKQQQRLRSAVTDGTVAARNSANSLDAAVRGAAAQTAGALRSLPVPLVTVNVAVTPAAVQKSTVIQYRYGPPTGSAGSITDRER